MIRKLIVVAVAAVALVGCAPSPDVPSGAPSGGTSASPAVSGTITVLAAASLQGTFTQLGAQFEAAHPGTKVQFSFGGSSDLAAQINAGSPADVFASASATNMKQVTDAGNATGPVTFAKNILQIAVPPTNPGQITELADLVKPNVKVALCQAEVPCGVVAAKVFTNANLDVKPVTREADVKSTLAKVQLGEVDAGVVYVTDVLAAGDKVKGIDIPAAVNASTEYPIAALAKAPNAAGAKAFVDYVLSAQGQTVITAAGFAKP